MRISYRGSLFNQLNIDIIMFGLSLLTGCCRSCKNRRTSQIIIIVGRVDCPRERAVNSALVIQDNK